jgi:rod shape-determining protein MreC
MNKYTRTFISITMVILVTILLHSTKIIAPAEDFLTEIASPASNLVYTWSLDIRGETRQFNSVSELEEAYRAIADIQSKTLIDYTQFEEMKEENATLKEQLGFLNDVDQKYAFANVIGKNIDPSGSTIIIDEGSESGINKNDPVVVDRGVLVGKIAEVNKNSSVVQLINDNNSKLAATIINMERSIGLIEGGYGISVRMGFIPQNEQVEIGDVVITSGLEDSMPYGLVVGTIESIEKEVYEPFQKAIVASPKQLDRLRIVSVLTK